MASRDPLNWLTANLLAGLWQTTRLKTGTLPTSNCLDELMANAQTLTDNWQTTKSDFPQVSMTLWSWFLAAKKGSKPLVPSSSCQDILISGEAEGDGEYWIDPTDSGNAFPVFCDMTSVQGTYIELIFPYYVKFSWLFNFAIAKLKWTRWHRNYYLGILSLSSWSLPSSHLQPTPL